MSFFKKLFGVVPSIPEEKEQKQSQYNPDVKIPADELFTLNFHNNGGKFLYCENAEDLNEQLVNILEENDWFEKEALCYDERLFHFLNDNNITHQNVKNPAFFFTTCENLIADEGSVILSYNQTRDLKNEQLPENIILYATTSQIIGSKTESMSEIKNRYNRNYPTNIRSISHFGKKSNEDFMSYGAVRKNLYLLLLEDL